MSQLRGAAAAVIAAAGYEAATMSAIAERADAPIGSLYQFFPNKTAIAHALRTEYVEHYETLLIALETDAQNLSLERLVTRLVNVHIGFIESHPAFLPLLDAPGSTKSPLSLRQRLRKRLAQCLRAVTPGVDKSTALCCATVALQMLKGLSQLYAELSSTEKRRFICEYRIALLNYLSARLDNGHAR